MINGCEGIDYEKASAAQDDGTELQWRRLVFKAVTLPAPWPRRLGTSALALHHVGAALSDYVPSTSAPRSREAASGSPTDELAHPLSRWLRRPSFPGQHPDGVPRLELLDHAL